MKIRSITTYCLLIVILSTSTLQSQEASVEKSLYGIQTGFWGVWGYNESKLNSKWVLRTELGLFDYSGTIDGLFLAPVISLEPRWYFNLESRLANGKRIDANSGSFLAFQLSLKPDFFSLPKREDAGSENPSISFIPTIGARKNIGKNFNFELGFGFGIGYFSKGGGSINAFLVDNSENNDGTGDTTYGNDDFFGTSVNLHVRIGYKL
ncbi:hypothetical protein [Lacinutrix sp. MEBiC02404]